MKLRTLTFLLTALAVAIPATLTGLGRDSDGSRMQARPLAVGATVSDRLSPPNDPVDWRYVRLKDAQDVSLSVSAKPENATANITLTDAMGKSLVRGKTSGGKFTTRRRLDPGLYYIAVAASRPVSYQISLR